MVEAKAVVTAAVDAATPGDEQQQRWWPWGRFMRVPPHPAIESGCLQLSRRFHRIGRDPESADIVLKSVFISKRHCEVTLIGAKEDGDQPIVMLLDHSFNGVFVNEEKVGKGSSVVLKPNDTVHFARPGIRSRTLEPLVFKFELLSGWTSTDGVADAGPVTLTTPALQEFASARLESKRSVGEVVNMDVDSTGTVDTINDDERDGGGAPARKKPRSELEVAASVTVADDTNLVTIVVHLQEVTRNQREKLKRAASRETELAKQLDDANRELAVLRDELNKTRAM